MEEMATYMRIRYRNFRVKALEFLGGKCVECGTTNCLEIDHVDPETKSCEPARLASLTWEKAVAELKKCQLLCDRHHNVKSIRERGQLSARVVHGTISSYRYCKCDLCRKAKSESNKSQRLRRLMAS
jgi:hypothetical protein